MDDESLRSRLDAAALPAAPDDAQLEAIVARGHRIRQRRRRQALVGLVTVLIVVTAGAFVGIRPGARRTAVATMPGTVTTAPSTTAAPFGTGGGKLLYTRIGDNGVQTLFSTYGDGTENGPMPVPTSGEISGPAWSPNHSQIAFSVDSGSDQGIWVMAPDGSGARHLTTGQDINSRWSPDGASLALTRLGDAYSYQLVIVSVGSGDEVASAAAYTESIGGWAPDSSSVAYTDEQAGPAEGEVHGGNIFLLRRSGGQPVQITRDGEPGRGPPYHVSEWEPNGRITYSRWDTNASGTTYTSRADGSDQVQLLDHPGSVRWSSSGVAAIAVIQSGVSLVDGQGNVIASIAAPERRGTGDFGLAWSADGSVLAISAGDGLQFVRPDGSRISTPPVGTLAPSRNISWSPDGRLLAGVPLNDRTIGVLYVASVTGPTKEIGPYSGLMCCGVWVDW